MNRRQKTKDDKTLFKTFRKSQRYKIMFTTTKSLKALQLKSHFIKPKPKINK